MPRFQFRLERILSVRRHQEDRERLRFGQAMRRKLECAVKLDEVRARIREAVERASAVTAGRPTVEDFVRMHEYRLALLRREADAERALEDAAVALEQQRLKLVEARRRRRALELLRERKWREWRRTEEEREQQELDEIGMTNFIRRAEDDPAAAEDLQAFVEASHGEGVPRAWADDEGHRGA